MTTLRYGILSTSSIAPRFIAGVRQANAGEIVAVSSRSLEKAREKASQWQIPTAYGSHQALLEDESVNIVYISAVNSQHYPWAKAAILRGKHVICEKPCTTTAQQSQELFRLAKEQGVFFMEAEKMVLLPGITEAKKRIQRGDLGQIYQAQLTHSFPASYNGWMFDKEVGGGPLLSSGIYAVQLMLFLFGQIKEITGKKSALPSGVEWQYILSGETESGVLFSAANSTQAVLENTARIYGTKGFLEIPQYWKTRKVIFHIQGQEPEEVAFPCEYELSYEAEHIAQCIEEGLLTSPVVTPWLTVSGISALEQVQKSW